MLQQTHFGWHAVDSSASAVDIAPQGAAPAPIFTPTPASFHLHLQLLLQKKRRGTQKLFACSINCELNQQLFFGRERKGVCKSGKFIETRWENRKLLTITCLLVAFWLIFGLLHFTAT